MRVGVVRKGVALTAALAYVLTVGFIDASLWEHAPQSEALEVRQVAVSPAPSRAPAAAPMEEPVESEVLSTPSPVEPIKNGSPSDPVGLTIPDAAVNDASVYAYTDAMLAATDNIVEPSDLESVAWWQGGGRPGATPENSPKPAGSAKQLYTSYVYGHSWTEPAVFNGIRALQVGATTSVRTADGSTYLYEIQQVFTVSKPLMGKNETVKEDVVGRLILVSCFRPDDYDPNAATVDNVIAVGQLVSYTPPS